MEKKLLPPLCKAIILLEKHGYRYAVIGSITVSMWGRTRAVHSNIEGIDIWICSLEDLIIQF